MSMVLSLTSVAIIAAFTVSSSAMVGLLDTAQNEKAETENGIETMFVDQELLLKTLQSFDCHVKASENEILVETSCGVLRYARADAGENFKMYVDEINDVDALVQNIREFETVYGRNVQAYTYDHIRENLSENMTLSEVEALEDDSLYLTITVD